MVGIAIMLTCADISYAEADGFGPFPTRNFQPFQLLVLGMPGERAAVVKPRTLDIRVELADTASIFLESTNPPDFRLVRSTVKFEQLRTGFFFRYGLTERIELRFEVPTFYRYEGVLEGLIPAVERLTSGETSTRAALKNTGFALNISRDGRTLFSGGDHQLGLGDMTLSSKYQVFKEDGRLPAVALRLAIKVPSGDAARVFGSGHTDIGIGLAGEKAISANWIVYANVNGVFPTGSIAGLSLSPTISGLAAAEYVWSPSLSVVAQFDYYSSPFRHTGVKLLDRGVTETVFGFNYRLRKNLLWQVYGIENLDFISGAAADVTLSTAVTYRFGH